MNEQIRELVGQAKFMAEGSINKKISVNAELLAFADIFARLIVQECIEQCNATKEQMRDQDPFWEDVATQCREDIRARFEIEE